MALVLRSLSDFKRFLAKPGATIRVVRNTFIDRQGPAYQEAYRRKGMYAPRTVQALSKKAAVFGVQGHPTTIWLYWDRGTRKWRFADDTVAIPLNTGLGPPDEIVYRCGHAVDAQEPQAEAVDDPPSSASATPPDGPTMPEHGQGQLL